MRYVRAPDGAMALDVRARVESRGAYTCPNPSCVRRAVERGGFQRAYDAAVIVDAEQLVLCVSTVLEGEVLAGLGLARRASQLVAGREESWRAHATNRATALVVARDLSDRSRNEVTEALAGRVEALVGPTKESMGCAIGRKPTGVVALLSGSIITRVSADLRRASGFRFPVPTSPTSTASAEASATEEVS